MRRIAFITLLAGIAAVLLLYPRGSASERREAEPRIGTQVEAQPAVAAAFTETRVMVTPIAPATASEAQAAFGRVYGKNLELHPELIFNGDFNGDGSGDLAVVATPRANEVAALNEELANWIVQDATSTTPAAGKHPRVTAQAPVLAILHGYGAHGWRDAAAQQSYLVLAAVGDRMEVEPVGRLVEAMHMKPSKDAHGEVLRSRIGGSDGYLFWDGAAYEWRAEAALAKSHPAPHGMGVSPHRVR
jgi:hypothetical protein